MINSIFNFENECWVEGKKKVLKKTGGVRVEKR